MAKKTVNIGTSANKGNGDPLRTAFGKINDNFDEIYAAIGSDGTIFNPLNVDSHLLPDGDNTRDLGSPAKRWRDIFVAPGSLYIGDIKLSNVNGSLVVQQVTNAGSDTESVVNTDAAPTDRLVNGENEFVLLNDGTVELNGNPFTGGGGYNQSLNTDDAVSFASVGATVGYIAQINGSNPGDELVVQTGGTHNFNFLNSGKLQLPAGGDIIDSNGNSVLGINQQYIELINQAAPLNIWAGPEVAFTKTDGGSEVDTIDTDLSITRGNNQGIYNSALEEGWDNQYGDPDGRGSPKGTVWNSDGWDNLTNLDQRTYTTFYATMNGGLGNQVLGRLFIMKDVANNTYYKIDFTVWGNANNGAPVTYTRQQVNPTDGTDIGSPVEFIKPGYADPFLVFDNISAEVHISRASNQSIFNTVSEQGYNDNSPGDGDGRNSPQGTEWNLDGWLDLTDVKQRTYKPWVEAFDYNVGERIVGTECVMHDTINDKYYAIKFTQWTGVSNGGGFAYKRRLINADAVFVHTENGSEVDDIAEGVGITRGSGGAIYNPYDEGEWDDSVSPGGTEWNFDGNHDLSDIEDRVYRTFWEAIQYYGIGWKIEGKEAVMRVTSTGDYYTIKFLNWQQGGGGAFSYIRTAVDLTQVNEGIRFADGTVQKTAANNQVKFKGPLGRRIEEYYGYEEVDITEAQEYTLDTTMRGYYVNTDYVQINLPDEQAATQVNNNIMRNASVSFDNGVTWISLSSNSGGWGQYPPGSWYASRYTLNGVRITYTDGQPVKFKYWRNGEPKLWFDPEKSPGGAGNFRGAIIDYHAYCDEAGTVIGQIIVSNDSGDFNVTHTESTSGGSNLPEVVLWHSVRNNEDYNDNQGEGKLYAYKVDGENDTIKIQWKATMFYGVEFWD